MKIGDFAAKVGISRIHLGRLMRAEGIFKTSLFEKIETVTGGDLRALAPCSRTTRSSASWPRRQG